MPPPETLGRVIRPAAGQLGILTPGLDGFICPPADVEAYATVLAQLIADPDLRHTIGAAARRTSLT